MGTRYVEPGGLDAKPVPDCSNQKQLQAQQWWGSSVPATRTSNCAGLVSDEDWWMLLTRWWFNTATEKTAHLLRWLANQTRWFFIAMLNYRRVVDAGVTVRGWWCFRDPPNWRRRRGWRELRGHDKDIRTWMQPQHCDDSSYQVFGIVFSYALRILTLEKKQVPRQWRQGCYCWLWPHERPGNLWSWPHSMDSMGHNWRDVLT
jgi:hypothetical protein